MTRERDHYLAAMHLRGFSPDGRRLWQFDREVRSLQFVSARDAGIERHLNTIIDDGAVDRSLETYMARANEDQAAPVLQRLRHAALGPIVLTAEENDALARYVTLTYARSPGSRARSRRNAAEVARRMAREFEDSRAFAYAIYARGVRMDAFALEVLRLQYLVELRAGRIPNGVVPWLIVVDRALDKPPPLVGAMPKVVVRRDAPPWMVLGDCAVLLINDEQYGGQGSLGFGVADVRVVVPLSADAFLICAAIAASDAPAAVERWRTDAYAAYVNRAAVDHAARFLWAREHAHLERIFIAVEHDLMAPA